MHSQLHLVVQLIPVLIPVARPGVESLIGTLWHCRQPISQGRRLSLHSDVQQ